MATQQQSDPVFAEIDKATRSSGGGTAVAEKDPVFGEIDAAVKQPKQPNFYKLQPYGEPSNLFPSPQSRTTLPTALDVPGVTDMQPHAVRGLFGQPAAPQFMQDEEAAEQTRDAVRRAERTLHPIREAFIGPDTTMGGLGNLIANLSVYRQTGMAGKKLKESLQKPLISMQPTIEAIDRTIPTLPDVPAGLSPVSAAQGFSLLKGGLKAGEGFLTPENVALVAGFAGVGGVTGALATRVKGLDEAYSAYKEAGEWDKAAKAASTAQKLSLGLKGLQATSFAVGTKYTIDFASDLYENSKEFKKAVDEGDQQKAMEVLGEALPNAAFTVAGVKEIIEAGGRVRTGIKERAEARRMARADVGLPGETAVPEPEIVQPGQVPEGLRSAASSSGVPGETASAVPEATEKTPEAEPAEPESRVRPKAPAAQEPAYAADVRDVLVGQGFSKKSAKEAVEKGLESPDSRDFDSLFRASLTPTATAKATPANLPEEPPSPPEAERRVTAGVSPTRAPLRLADFQGPPSRAVLDDVKKRLTEPGLTDFERETLEARKADLEQHPEDVEALRGQDLGRIRAEARHPQIADEVTREIEQAAEHHGKIAPTSKRSYDEVQKDIDDAYDAAGFGPDATASDLIKFDESNAKMRELYAERDAIGARELQESIGEISGRLKHIGLKQNEIDRVLNIFALDPKKRDAFAQYQAEEYTKEFATTDLARRAEDVAIALAAERGEDFDEVRDISSQTKRDAARATKDIYKYFKGEAPVESPRLEGNAEEEPTEKFSVAEEKPTEEVADEQPKPEVVEPAKKTTGRPEGYQRQLAQLYVNRLKNPIKKEFAQRYLTSRLRQIASPDSRGVPIADVRSVRSNIDELLTREKSVEAGKLFSTETTETAKAMVAEAASFLGDQQKPGRYFADLGEETPLTGRGAKTPITAVSSMRHMFPWFEEMKESPKQLIDAVNKGSGKTYDRLVQAAADYWDRRQEEAKPILEELGPQAKELAEQIREIDPELAERLDDVAAGKFPTYDSLAQFEEKVKNELNDARAAASFGDAVDELAEHEAAESYPDRESLQEGLEPTPESREEVRPKESVSEGILPGMEGAVEEQKKAAAEEQGRRLTEEFNRPPESIESRAGAIETLSPLFRGTEASPQSEMFSPRSEGLLRTDIPEINRARTLSNYTDKVFHEADAETALALIEPGTEVPEKVHLSTREEAAGEGGILLGFDPSNLKGKIREAQGWEDRWRDGNAHFDAVGNVKADWDQSLESITVRPQTKMKQGMRNRLAKQLRVLQDSGWTKHEDDDGGVTWSRPERAEGLALRRTAAEQLVPGSEVYRVERNEAGTPVYTRGLVQEGQKVQLQDKTVEGKTSPTSKITVPLDEKWQVKAPEPEATEEYGENNVLVDKSAYQEARENIMKKSGRLSAGVDPTSLADLVKVGVYHLEAGARQFGKWSRAMMRDLGGWVRGSLRDIWNRARKTFTPGGEEKIRGEGAPEERQTEPSGIPEEPLEAESKAAQPGEKAINIRLDKLNSPEDVIDLIRQTAKTNKGRIQYQRRGRLSDAELGKRMEQVGLDPDKLSRLPRGKALNEAEIEVAIGIMQSEGEKVRDAQREAQRNNSDENILKAQALHNRYVAIHAAVSGITAEAGRSLRTFRRIHNALDREEKGGYERMIDALGGRKLTDLEARKLLEIPTDDKIGYAKFLRDHGKYSTADKLVAYWKNNILSSPRTVIRKMTGDAIMTGLNFMKIGFRPVIDPLVAPIQRRPVKYRPQDAGAQVAAFVSAIPEGMKRAAFIMRNGFDIEDAEELNLPRYELPGGAVTNYPSRLLSAATEFFKTVHTQSTLAGEAMREALGRGLRGKAAADYAAELFDNPPDEMLDRAEAEGRKLALVEDPDSFLNAVNRVANLKIPEGYPGVGGLRPLQFVIPFRNIAWNLGKQAVRYSPIGAARAVKEGVRKGPELTNVLAETLIGSLILAALAQVASQGALTGPTPKSAGKRDAFYRAGKQPFSVKVGNRWVSYTSALAVLTPMMAATAAWWDAYQDNQKKPSAKQISQAAAAIGAAATDQPLLRGIQNLNEALTNPTGTSAERMLSEAVGGFIPASSLLRTTAQAIDPAQRDAQGVYERIQQGLPYASKKLPQRIDALGRGETRRAGGGAAAFLPTGLPEAEPLSATDAELGRLQDLGMHQIAPPGQFITVQNTKIPLTRDQQREYQLLRGTLLREVLGQTFDDPGYKSLDDQQKIKETQSVIRQVEDFSRDEMINRLVERLDKKSPKEESNAVPMEP